MKFLVKHKTNAKFFKGFDNKDQPLWTMDKSQAWSSDRMVAKCQALLLVKFGAQQKPVAL